MLLMAYMYSVDYSIVASLALTGAAIVLDPLYAIGCDAFNAFSIRGMMSQA